MVYDNDHRSMGRAALRRTAFAIGAVVVGATMLIQASQARSTADRQQQAGEESQLLGHRATLARGQMDELNRLLLAALDGRTIAEPTLSGSLSPLVPATDAADPLVGPSARWAERLEAELAAVELLADGDDPVAREAGLILQELGQFDVSLAATDLEWLSYTFYTFRFHAVPDSFSSGSAQSALAELVWADEALTLTLNEAVVGMVGRSDVEFEDESSAYYVDEVYGTVLSYGGGFVGRPGNSLAGSIISLDSARAFEEEIMREVGGIVGQTDAVQVDRWLESLSDTPDNPFPGDIFEFAAQNEAATAEVRAVIDRRLTEEATRASSAAESARTAARLWLLGALAMLALALAAAVAAARSGWLRSRSVQRMVNIDPLTGVGNRNLLAQDTAALVYGQRFSHHVMVTIDLDRFKVINDTFGHLVGDQVLVTLADGLRSIAESAPHPCTVVRLGGDEFLISFHGAAPIDTGHITDRLERLRSQIIQIDPVLSIPLEFSFGIAEATGSPPLSQLLDASDLAAYEEKAARRNQRPLAAHHGSDGLSIVHDISRPELPPSTSSQPDLR